MINEDEYYHLSEACTLLNRSYDALVRLAAGEELKVYLLTNDRAYISRGIKQDGVWSDIRTPLPQLAEVDSTYFKKIALGEEIGVFDFKVIVETDLGLEIGNPWAHSLQRGFADFIEPTNLVILRDDLVRLLNNSPNPAGNNKKSVTVKLTPLMKKRLACIEAYINSLQKACNEKKVKFNPKTMLLTKEQIHAQLEKYYPDDFNVKKDTWKKIWKAATDNGICNNYQPKTSKGELFLKSINF